MSTIWYLCYCSSLFLVIAFAIVTTTRLRHDVLLLYVLLVFMFFFVSLHAGVKVCYNHLHSTVAARLCTNGATFRRAYSARNRKRTGKSRVSNLSSNSQHFAHRAQQQTSGGDFCPISRAHTWWLPPASRFVDTKVGRMECWLFRQIRQKLVSWTTK